MRRIIVLSPSFTYVIGSVGGCRPSDNAVSCSSCFYKTAIRAVQFQQTSETIRGVQKGEKELAQKWITKSTKDYVQEATRTLASNPVKDRMRATLKEKKDFVNEVQESGEKKFDIEMSRLQDTKQRRWRKTSEFFKRQGIAFTGLYFVAYFGTLLIFYVAFATGALSKELAFGATTLLLQGWVTHDEFYTRVEAWDTYINFGFAFVINEAIEIIRFPLIMFTFYTFRPLLMGMFGRTKKTIFRRSAPES